MAIARIVEGIIGWLKWSRRLMGDYAKRINVPKSHGPYRLWNHNPQSGLPLKSVSEWKLTSAVQRAARSPKTNSDPAMLAGSNLKAKIPQANPEDGMPGRKSSKSHLRAIVSRAEYYAWAIRSHAMSSVARLYRPASKNKLIILDPALVDYNGHHAEFAHIMMRGLASRYNVQVYSNFTAKTALIVRTKAQPIFYDTIYSHPDARDFEGTFTRKTRLLVDSLRRIDPHDLRSTTIAVMHTATIFQLEALAEWFCGLPEAQRPRLFIQFQFPPEYTVPAETNWHRVRRRIRVAAESLVANGIVRFTANSRPLVDLWADQLGQPCTLMPVPVRWPDKSDALPPPEKLTFGFFGGLRREKGARLLEEAVPAFLESHRDARFIVHAPITQSDENTTQVLRKFTQVELLPSAFATKEAYFHQFLRAGCILLPYDPAAYAVRTSGVLLEALGLGRLILTTRGTWMEAAMRDRPASSVVMARYTGESLLESLDKAYGELLQRSGSPIADAETMRANSPAAFCEALIKLMQS